MVIIGAGMSGLGAAIKLLTQGYACTLIEQASAVGGLAGSFVIQGKYFPFGYHHILSEDKPLLEALKAFNIYPKVRWKKGKVLFAIDRGIYDLTSPRDFWKFPMPIWSKIRFVLFMGYCFLKADWSMDLGNAKDWLDKMAGNVVRQTIFDPLMDIKYGLPSEYLSANWLGSRLHYQEFAKPLGYIPGTDWTQVLNEKMEAEVKRLGGTIVLNAQVTGIKVDQGVVTGVEYEKEGKTEMLKTSILINTAPPASFLKWLTYEDPQLTQIEYLDALSLILETKQVLPRELYLLSCLSPRYSFGGIFTLSSLNQTLGVQQGTVINFFTTLSRGAEHLRDKTKEELLQIYQVDFEKLFGFKLAPAWSHLSFIKNYSPKFLKGYQNPDPRGKVKGIYFAGNYLTYPTITSTGSALASGQLAADCIIKDYAT